MKSWPGARVLQELQVNAGLAALRNGFADFFAVCVVDCGEDSRPAEDRNSASTSGRVTCGTLSSEVSAHVDRADDAGGIARCTGQVEVMGQARWHGGSRMLARVDGNSNTRASRRVADGKFFGIAGIGMIGNGRLKRRNAVDSGLPFRELPSRDREGAE